MKKVQNHHRIKKKKGKINFHCLFNANFDVNDFIIRNKCDMVIHASFVNCYFDAERNSLISSISSLTPSIRSNSFS